MVDDPVTPDLSAFGPEVENARDMWAGDPASFKLGITAVQVDLREPGPSSIDGRPLGHAIARMTVDERMVNGHDICHGGYMFIFADSTFALACNAGGELTVAAGCDIDFVRSAALGDVLLAKGIERARYGRNGITDVTVTRESDGELIAHFRGRSRALKPRPSA